MPNRGTPRPISSAGTAGSSSSGDGEALADNDAATAFHTHLHATIDPDDNQIRLYRLAPETLANRAIYGRRTIEERADFWIT